MYGRLGVLVLFMTFSVNMFAQNSPPPMQYISIAVEKEDPFCGGVTSVMLVNKNESSRVVATIRIDPDKSLPDLIFDRYFNQISPLRYPQTYPELLLPGERKRLACGSNMLPGGKPQFSVLGAYYPVANLDFIETGSPEDSIVLKLNNSEQALLYCNQSSLKVPAAKMAYEAVNISRKNRLAFFVSNKTPKSFNGAVSLDPLNSIMIACDNEVIVKNVTLSDFSFIRYGFY